MKISATIKKCLDNYAEKDSVAVENLNHTFTHVITIPAHNETIETIKAVFSALPEKNILIILVVNASKNSTLAAKKSNQKLMADIKNEFPPQWESTRQPGMTLHPTGFGGILLVDRSSPSVVLPEKSGVGLARKIAADLALRLMIDGKVSSTWINCTDADAQLSPDYFQKIATAAGCAAALHPYTHRTTPTNSRHHHAALLYELSLRRYVIGLQYANSTSAFHSIGSTISVDSAAYAAVRGFPVRECGEDFYLLNKLNKSGKIGKLTGDPIILDGRFSSRVPFGTGKSVEKIAALDEMETKYLFYHPDIFHQLKIWLQTVSTLDHDTNLERLKSDFARAEKCKHLNVALARVY